MKKILMLLGLVAASAAPLAASAHTDVRIGVNLGTPVVSYRVPAYYDYGRVETVHYDRYSRHYSTRPYVEVDYRRPVVIVRDRPHARWDRHDRHDRHERREHRHHHHN